jgi:transposase
VARMGEERNVYSVLVGKPERKRPLGRPRRRWRYGIKKVLEYIGWRGVEWIQLAWNTGRWLAVVNNLPSVSQSVSQSVDIFQLCIH